MTKTRGPHLEKAKPDSARRKKVLPVALAHPSRMTREPATPRGARVGEISHSQ